MTGFAADWLALREPVDRCARSAPVLAATRLWADRRATPGCALRVVDLGAGTGGNLRCLAPYLSAPQAWTLVDDDPACWLSPGAPGDADASPRCAATVRCGFARSLVISPRHVR
jgi:hypothetical protein